MTTKMCPCEDCIALAICRHKLWGYLFRDCILLREYIPHHDTVHMRDVEKTKTVCKILTPTHWVYEFDSTLNVNFPVVRSKGTIEDLRKQHREDDNI